MSIVFQQLSTVLNIYLNKLINTGDKIIDSSLVAVVCMLLSSIILYIYDNYTDFYNCIIYYAYRMYNKPYDLNNAPYIINLKFNTTSEKFLNNLYMVDFDYEITSNYRKKICNFETFEEIILKIINKTQIWTYNNIIYNVIEPKHQNDEYTKLSSGFYPIAMGYDGSTIYFATDGYLYGKNYSSTMKVKNILISYIENEVKNMNINTNDGIYLPKFNDNILSFKHYGVISKKKTFNTLFYDDKDKLINMLTRFKNKKMYPDNVPMDNKIGILLYGPPGTGKTGTIMAVANMLKRSIVVINFTTITKCHQLDEILHSSHYDKYVYVFDEFDCILDSLGKDKNKNNIDYGSLLLVAEGEERKNIIDMVRDSKSNLDADIDMSYLLQKLDGLQSAENRVIIATTNNPERINPTLLRPGRFDIKLCLDKCTTQMYADILTNYYNGGEKMHSIIMTSNIPEKKYAPLDLINLAIQYDTLEDLLKVLQE